MKVICEKSELVSAVSEVGRLSTVRATLPILQNLYLEAEKDVFIIKATDLEQTIERRIKVEVAEKGRVTIPTRLLTDFLQTNPDPKLTLTTDDLTLIISSEHHKAKFRGQAADDYPQLSEVEKPNTFNLDSNTAKDLINKTLFASSLDDSRPVLNSILWRFKGEEVDIVATDGYRLALNHIKLKTSFTTDCIVPRRAMQEVVRLMNTSQVEVAFSESQLTLKFGDTVFTSRVLEATYPDYEAILPKKKSFSISVKSGELLQSLKLASIFSRDTAYSTKIILEGNVLKVTAISPQLGESSNQLSLAKEVAEPFSISVNAQYLIDVLNVIDGDIDLVFIDSKSPVVVTSPKYADYLYLVMPLRSD